MKTHGLSHVAHAVLNLDRRWRSTNLYLGCEIFSQRLDRSSVGPRAYDVLALKRPAGAGVPGGIIHFGFWLTRPNILMRP